MAVNQAELEKAVLANEEAEMAKEKAALVKKEHSMEMDRAQGHVKASKAKLDKTSSSDIAYVATNALHEKNKVELVKTDAKLELAKARLKEASAEH